MLWPPKTTHPARQHPQELPYLLAAMGIPYHSYPPDISIVPQRWMLSCERLASGHMARLAERAFAGTEYGFP